MECFSKYSTFWLFFGPMALMLAAGSINPFVSGAFFFAVVFVLLFVVGLLVFIAVKSLKTAGAPILTALQEIPEFLVIACLVLGAWAGLAPNSSDSQFQVPVVLLLGLLQGVARVAENVARVAENVRRSKWFTRAIAVVGILVGLLIFRKAGFSFQALKNVIFAIPVTQHFQYVVTLISAVVGIVVLGAILGAAKELIEKIAKEPLMFFALPTGLSLVNLMTIIQGFTGLREHYDFFKNLAFGGIIVAVLGIFATVAFGVVALRKGLQRRDLAHYFLALATALTVGCLVLYGLAEATGYWYKNLRVSAP